MGEWVAKAPRYGRQYFYYDYDLDAKKIYHDLIYDKNNGNLSNMIPPPENYRVPNSNY